MKRIFFTTAMLIGSLGTAFAASGVTILSPSAPGQDIYAAVCQACHMANANGGIGAGTIPALSSNPNLAAADYPVTLILAGRGAMPGFSDLLTPAQIASVATYVRTHFGNNYTAPVTTDAVENRMRGLGPH